MDRSRLKEGQSALGWRIESRRFDVTMKLVEQSGAPSVIRPTSGLSYNRKIELG